MVSLTASFNQLVGQKMYSNSKKAERLEYVGISIIAILIPLIFQHPQILVGSLVNCALIMSGINICGWKKLVPVIVLPSISALLNGYLFGILTIYLVYLLPFIWIGNAILVLIFKQIYVQNKNNYIKALATGAIFKTLAIFLGAILFINLCVIPSQFAKLMGMMQLITALFGGGIAFIVNFIYKKYFPLA